MDGEAGVRKQLFRVEPGRQRDQVRPRQDHRNQFRLADLVGHAAPEAPARPMLLDEDVGVRVPRERRVRHGREGGGVELAEDTGMTAADPRHRVGGNRRLGGDVGYFADIGLAGGVDEAVAQRSRGIDVEPCRSRCPIGASTRFHDCLLHA